MNSLFISKIYLGVIRVKFLEGMGERTGFFIKLAIITLGVYLGFRFILPLILPFIIAYLLAWIVRPTTELLYRRAKIPRTIGGSISVLLLISIVVLSLFYLGNILIRQFISFARSLPVYLSILTAKLDYICSNCDEIFGLSSGSVRALMDDNIRNVVNKVKTDIIPGMTARTFGLTVKIVGLIGIFLIILISAVLIIKEAPELQKKYKNSDLYNDLNSVTVKLADAGVAYLRAQLLIMILVAVCCVTGLVVIRNEYALLLGIFIAILDALPIIGSGMILIPWSIIMLINGNIFAAAILITVYLLCQIIREIVEPKLIGNRIGIRPLYTLMSMYVGLKLFGIAGFILGPVGLIIIIAIIKSLNEKKENDQSLNALDKGLELE
jgi:sporulation integral membrane protein YtvI